MSSKSVIPFHVLVIVVIFAVVVLALCVYGVRNAVIIDVRDVALSSAQGACIRAQSDYAAAAAELERHRQAANGADTSLDATVETELLVMRAYYTALKQFQTSAELFFAEERLAGRNAWCSRIPGCELLERQALVRVPTILVAACVGMAAGFVSIPVNNLVWGPGGATK